MILDDVTLDCWVDGPESGPLAICLHGFPDTRDTYRYLSPRLVDMGYRVVIPAMRGYAPSSLASDANYQITALAHDALRLHDAFDGGDDAVIIGHDWGASAAYGALDAAPERWRRGVCLAVPPLGVVASSFFGYDQLRAVWYMWFFQLPLADLVVPMDDLAFVERLWRDWSPGFDPSGEMPAVRAALGHADNLAAALGYYRAMFDAEIRRPEHEAIAASRLASPSVPVLYLHGANDGCILAANVATVTEHLAAGSRAVTLADCGHFLHLERPGEVNELIADFLSA